MNDTKFLELIKTVRFPLICLVVFAHSIGFSFDPVKWMDFSSANVFSFVSQMISHNLAKIAVCQFFFFSGYLFFRNLVPDFWGWCLKKWKNRIHTLLIPFVAWNLIAVLAVVAKNLLFSLFGRYDASEMELVTSGNILDWFRIPADFPLWYMEDLMFMVLMAPVIYYAVRKFKVFALLLLVLAYVYPYEPGMISMRAIFFFGTGAYCSIRKVDVLDICRKIRIPCYVLAVITLMVSTLFNSAPNHEWIIRFFYPFGIVSFLNIMDSITSSNAVAKSRLQNLAESVFFVYAAHEVYILGWTKGLCLRVFGDSLAAQYARYFLVPVIVIFVTLAIYRILKKFFPRALSIVCGGR